MVDSALGEIDENIHNYNINCDRSFGYIYAATNSYQLRELEILHNRLRTKYNYEQTTLLEKCDLDKLVKTTRYTGALFDKTCGQINPLKYLVGLTQQLKEMNVRVFEQSPFSFRVINSFITNFLLVFFFIVFYWYKNEKQLKVLFLVVIYSFTFLF